MLRNIGKYLVMLGLLIGIAACSSDEDEVEITEDEEAGTFKATFTGDFEAEFEGTAIFTEFIDPTTENIFFVLYLETGVEGDATHTWLSRGGERPVANTYPILELNSEDLDAPSDWIFETGGFMVWTVTQNGEEIKWYLSDEGSIVIARSVEGSVSGTFELTATGFLTTEPDEDLEIEITCEFNAAPGVAPL
jgi:hypothetical protein